MLMSSLAGAVLWTLASLPGQSPAAPDPAKIDAVFAAYDKAISPGCALAVYQGDAVAYRKAYGMANLDHDIPLTPSTVFHVASISKQFTGTAILLLAQDGKLSLDDDIRKHLPELQDFGKTITIRQLANHTSGLRDQWDLLGLAGWRYSRDLITDDDVMELLVRQKDLNFPPGDRHLYSNSGFTLLAVIVSRVSGQSFREFTTERIFKPLGMTRTHFRDNFAEIVKHQAYGYAPVRDTFRLSVTNFDTAGATSLLTTVEDLLKWHANFDTRTVGGDALQSALLERGLLNSGSRISYAFGITHGTYRGVPTVGHGGSDAGYRADFVRFPEQKLGVATLCNIGTANPGQLSRRVADLFLPANLPAATTESPADDTPEVPVPEATLKRLAGIYWNAAEATALRVVFDAGTLHAVDGRQRTALKSVGGGAFVMTAGPRTRVSFEEQAGGAVHLKPGGSAPVFVRMDPYTPSADQVAEFAGTYRSDEMDAVFRMTVKDGALRLERSKLQPAPLEPMITDTFRTQAGLVQFTRDGAGRVTGFVLQGNRVKHVKFRKDTPASGSSASDAR
ncbi:MAG: serine hydrolase domain-containing protein [Vicinamibacterales bacterium]